MCIGQAVSLQLSDVHQKRISCCPKQRFAAGPPARRPVHISTSYYVILKLLKCKHLLLFQRAPSVKFFLRFCCDVNPLPSLPQPLFRARAMVRRAARRNVEIFHNFRTSIALVVNADKLIFLFIRSLCSEKWS